MNRIEHDLLGDRTVPSDAYWGVHTLRAVENFPISGQTIGQVPDLIRALAAIKQAAAVTNEGLGLLDPVLCDAIVTACQDISAGALHDQFIVDQIQGGAGTSTNMNANEVITNRALEIMGHARGRYDILHPNEHVNLSQSTNDVYPTALKLAAWFGIQRLIAAMASLRGAFADKAVEFSDVLKMGRTQLQEAVPMTLGQEFNTFAVMLGEDEARLDEAARLILEINLGATAIGTGINSHPDYAEAVRAELARITGVHGGDSGRSYRGDPGLRCFRAAFGRAEAGCGQAVQNLQRPAPVVIRAPRGLQRDQPARNAGGVVDHAGQG